MSPDFLHPGQQHAWLHHDLLHLDRSIMALADAMNAMAQAVADATAEMRELANAVSSTGDVQAATDQLNALAANLEQAVNDAHAAHPDVVPPVEDQSSGETPPDQQSPDQPPLDSPPV